MDVVIVATCRSKLKPILKRRRSATAPIVQMMSGAPLRAVITTRPGTFVIMSGEATEYKKTADLDELAVQREGYAQAIISKEFLQALKNGPNSRWP
jgi:PHD/YefM family antitoxin component YafN of YafNO toxin-antitoxin module